MNIDGLSPEMRERARACGTPEELLQLAREEGYELSDEELEQVSGGWCSGLKCRDMDKRCPTLQACGPALRW